MHEMTFYTLSRTTIKCKPIKIKENYILNNNTLSNIKQLDNSTRIQILLYVLRSQV